MFEKASIVYPGRSNGQLDIGRILDAMLYYQNVEFIVDGRAFHQLWDRLGPDGTLSLLSHSSLDCKVTPETPAVQNDNTNGIIAHRPKFISFAGHGDFRIDEKDTASKIAFPLDRDNFRENRSKVNKILNRVRETRYSKIFSSLPTKGDIFLDLIEDSETMRLFIRSYARKMRAHCNEALLRSLEVEVYSTPRGYVIIPNISLGIIVPGHFSDGWKKTASDDP